MKTVLSLILLAFSLTAAGGGTARDALISVMNSVGCDGEQITVVDVTAENSYVLGLDEDDFDIIASAALASSADGGRKAVIHASDKKSARRIYDKMWKSFEFPACDASDAIIFLKSGDKIAFFKGSDADVEAHSRAFCDAFGAEAMKLMKNPAK